MPVAVGVNVTSIVQLPPAATGELGLQVPAYLKSELSLPPITMPPMFIAEPV